MCSFRGHVTLNETFKTVFFFIVRHNSKLTAAGPGFVGGFFFYLS